MTWSPAVGLFYNHMCPNADLWVSGGNPCPGDPREMPGKQEKTTPHKTTHIIHHALKMVQKMIPVAPFVARAMVFRSKSQ